ncbi:MAG TPA: ABC transporter substrate-binding protein [Actinomycetota bacterium]|nr:ABC transporter substrate-binding protein [Actinomycetota bacterium]
MGARRTLVLLLALVLAASACDRTSEPPPRVDRDDAVTVASFNFPESVLLAEIYARALEAADVRVKRETALGTRELVMPALVQGLVELVPEYAGSALLFFSGPGSASADHDAIHRALASELSAFGVIALEASPAEDQNGFAVTRETAARLGLRSLSDLAAVADQLTFGGPPECLRRPSCLPGLESTYGIEFGDEILTLDSGGGRTVAALAQGTVDVALMFTSDGAVDLNDFVLLHDDRGLQPAENVTPVVRRDALERFPGLADALNAVSGLLSTDELRSMNAELALGADPRTIAGAWLARNGLAGA